MAVETCKDCGCVHDADKPCPVCALKCPVCKGLGKAYSYIAQDGAIYSQCLHCHGTGLTLKLPPSHP